MQFDMLKPYSRPKKNKDDEPKIKYACFEVDTISGTKKVSIPLRETERFEEAISSVSGELTITELKKFVREFRGLMS